MLTIFSGLGVGASAGIGVLIGLVGAVFLAGLWWLAKRLEKPVETKEIKAASEKTETA